MPVLAPAKRSRSTLYLDSLKKFLAGIPPCGRSILAKSLFGTPTVVEPNGKKQKVNFFALGTHKFLGSFSGDGSLLLHEALERVTWKYDFLRPNFNIYEFKDNRYRFLQRTIIRRLPNNIFVENGPIPTLEECYHMYKFNKDWKRRKTNLIRIPSYLNDANFRWKLVERYLISLNDRDLVFKFVKKEGRMLEFVSKKFQADVDVVIAAMLQHVEALQFAAPSLLDDFKFMKYAVSKRCAAIIYASEKVRKDRDLWQPYCNEALRNCTRTSATSNYCGSDSD